MQDALVWLSAVATLGAGLVAGIFFAFSSFVMRALERVPGSGGMRAMQAINVTVLNAGFLGAFMGMAVVSALAVGAALWGWGEPWAVPFWVGGLLYLLGTFGVTAARNVPLNRVLERVTPGEDGAAQVWVDYLRRWTFWNHVRTGASVLAAAAFALALYRLGGP